MSGVRTFKVVNVKKSNGCVTKHDANSRYKNKSPGGAARKAANALCLRKKIRGVCTLYVTIQECTRGCSQKQYTYMCKRSKLSPPKATFVSLEPAILFFRSALPLKNP